MRNMPPRLIGYTIFQDERDGNVIYLGTNLGVYRSADRGVTWAPVTGRKAAGPQRRNPGEANVAQSPAASMGRRPRRNLARRPLPSSAKQPFVSARRLSRRPVMKSARPMDNLGHELSRSSSDFRQIISCP
jgi:hypothetical protein